MDLRKKAGGFFFNEYSVFLYLWLGYLFFPVLLDLEQRGVRLGADEFVTTLYYMSLAGASNFILIPRFLVKGKYLEYLATILFMLILASVVEETAIEWMLDNGRRRDFDLSTGGLWFSFVRIGTIIIIFGSFKLFWDHQKKLRRISDLEKEQVESELKFLKSQINPHVMFNNLNNIYYYSLEDPEKVPPMILKLSEVMRYMIYEANEKYVPLVKELEYIRNFIELEKIRLEDRGEVQFDVRGEPGRLRIAPLLLISFIENSFKHSMETRNDDIRIRIEILIEGTDLTFKAENNWSESRQNDRPEREGIGLQNVRKRLLLLYPHRHTLQIEQTLEIYRVYLKIDLTNEED